MTRKEFIKLVIATLLAVLFGKAVKREEARTVIDASDNKIIMYPYRYYCRDGDIMKFGDSCVVDVTVWDT